VSKQAVRSVPARDKAPQRTEGPGLRILVVDDNRDAAETLAMLLRLLGHDVRVEHDGLLALQLADEFRPQVVLLDIGLPGLNGWETARNLRRMSWSHGLVLIALTGWAQDADRRRSRDAGFDHHLVKPIDMARLHRLLDSARAAPVRRTE
jgi:CheY-like chemotaxis protein